MFGQVGRTPYDIEFSLLGIPARVHPFFWIVSLIFGWSPDRPELMVLWVICVFFSILIHEMGHALMARAFGYDPHIVLYSFGGYAAYMPGHRESPWKSIAISFAGPLAGFVFFGVVIAVQIGLVFADVTVSRPVGILFGMLEYVNLYWGLVNLFPVLPLDGGRICESLLQLNRRIDYRLWALRISVGVGIAVAVLFLQIGARYPAVLFGLLALMSFQELSQRNQRW